MKCFSLADCSGIECSTVARKKNPGIEGRSYEAAVLRQL
jgi:hypothetical protein